MPARNDPEKTRPGQTHPGRGNHWLKREGAQFVPAAGDWPSVTSVADPK